MTGFCSVKKCGQINYKTKLNWGNRIQIVSFIKYLVDDIEKPNITFDTEDPFYFWKWTALLLGRI